MSDRLPDVGPSKPFVPDLASDHLVKSVSPEAGSYLAQARYENDRPQGKDYDDPHAFQVALSAWQLGVRLPRPPRRVPPEDPNAHSTFMCCGEGENR